MIRAIIFDMDGIIIDSEPLWHESEIEVFNNIGVPITREDCLKTQGVRIDEVVDFWYKTYPWPHPTRSEVAHQIVEGLISRIKATGQMMHGVKTALESATSLDVKIALASSSSYALIDTVIDQFNLRHYFEVIYSAQDESYGKPHPGVYITTAQKLTVRPDECVAIEDSVNGVISAKAAKMKCIAVPEPSARHDKRYGVADLVLDNLNQIDIALWQTIE